MAVYYAASGRKEAADLALAVVAKAMEFDRWDYFMEAGEIPMAIQRAARLVTAVSYTIEFLGDLVTEEMRERWLDKMIKDGIEPNYVAIHGMRTPEKVVGWGSGQRRVNWSGLRAALSWTVGRYGSLGENGRASFRDLRWARMLRMRWPESQASTAKDRC